MDILTESPPVVNPADEEWYLHHVTSDWGVVTPEDEEAIREDHARTAAPATLAEIVDREAAGYRAWQTPVGDFLASQMERLAQLIRFTGASTPAEHEDRIEVQEYELRCREYDRGYSDALRGEFSSR